MSARDKQIIEYILEEDRSAVLILEIGERYIFNFFKDISYENERKEKEKDNRSSISTKLNYY